MDEYGVKAEAIEIKGASPDRVEAIVTELFDRAQNSIIMSTGLYVPFYSREKIVKSMTNAAGRAGVTTFKIILDSNVNVEQAKAGLPWLFKLRDEGKVVQIVKSGYPIPHWMVVDARDIRLEIPHPPDQPGLNNLVVKNANAERKTSALLNSVSLDLDRFFNGARPT